MKFVDPKTDIAFKKIFGDETHKAILIEFLNELLELEYPIEDVKISNSYQPPRLSGLKETTLDIKAKDSSQREFIVEMQVEKELAFCKRAIYYSSKAYSQQLTKGEYYHLLKPVIFLGILDFSIFEHEHPCSRHLILNSETQSHDLTDLEFNFIELPKFTKQEHELQTVSDKWLYFIKNAENLDHVPDNADTEALLLAYNVAAQHHWTAEELDVYESQGIQLGKTRGMIETAGIEGELRGEMRGEIRGERKAKMEVARNLLAVMDDDAIAHITGLDVSLIMTLRQD
jgi:predicted transposase/invertase (TIGR01784 family)